MDEVTLVHRLGVLGSQLYYLARGIDSRPVEPGREVKSIGRETTFSDDITDREVLQTVLLELSADVGRRLRRGSHKGRTITLKIRYDDFSTISRSKTIDTYTNLDQDIYHEACRLLQELNPKQPVRLIGVAVHNISEGKVQPSLFEPEEDGREKLIKAIDGIKERFGEDSIHSARLLRK